MSVASVSQELSEQRGNFLLPDYFRNDLLIGLIYEMVRISEEAMPEGELSVFKTGLHDYARKLIRLHGTEQLAWFDSQADRLILRFYDELYAYLCDELVSRLIGYRIRKLSLHENLGSLLKESPPA